MPRYSEQFKRDAVALYENNEDLSLHTASAELGINRSSLYSWLKQYGTGKRAHSKNMRTPQDHFDAIMSHARPVPVEVFPEAQPVNEKLLGRVVPLAVIRAKDANRPTIYLLNGAGSAEQDSDWLNLSQDVDVFLGVEVNGLGQV